MDLLDERIRLHGQKGEKEDLQNLVLSIDDNDLLELIESKMYSYSFKSTWYYILQSFTNTPVSHTKRLTATLALLKYVHKDINPSKQSITYIEDICRELINFDIESLVQLCEFSLESIQAAKNESQTICTNLIPQLLNELITRDEFIHKDVKYTGEEFKSEYIASLCLLNWCPEIVTKLCSMFNEMALNKAEHYKSVTKLVYYFEKLTAQEIPAFTYQLLKLCEHRNSRLVFLGLKVYFEVRIYSCTTFNSESSEVNFDAIELTSDSEMLEAESTVLYHIYSASYYCIEDYLNSLKTLTKAPEYILNPFQLTVLFQISNLEAWKKPIFDIIRPSISRAFQEDVRKSNGFWFRELIPGCTPVEDTFRTIINASLQDRELIIQALVNFSFVLLDVSATKGSNMVAERQWHLGILILLKIIKRKSNASTTIIQQICNTICYSHNATQYVRLLYIVSRDLPILVLENASSITQLMEALPTIPVSIGVQVLDALIHICKVSPALRDQLILLLRKSMNSRTFEAREVAVAGFLELLTILKISNVVALSQSTQASCSYHSGLSVFTQLSMNRTIQVCPSKISDEALILEISSILKGCFMKQTKLRIILYEGLYETISTNADLGFLVLEFLTHHFQNYYICNNDSQLPLDFRKISELDDLSSEITEPLGKLIFTIGLILSKLKETDNENVTVIRYELILDELCDKLLSCELVHFGLDNGADLFDSLPESQQKLHILKEAMRVHEALMGYKICSWTINSVNQADHINRLFDVYKRLLMYFKKPKKMDLKKKNANTTTQQSNTTKAGISASKSAKANQPPDTIFDLNCISKAVALLNMPNLDWTTQEQANMVKSKYEIHRHVYQAMISLIQKMKKVERLNAHFNQTNFNHLVGIAKILYTKIVIRVVQFAHFDCTAAVLAMECFQDILSLVVSQYKNNLDRFLSSVGELDKSDGLLVLLKAHIGAFQKIFENLDENDISGDTEAKKLTTVIISTLTILINQIPSDNNPLSGEVLEWLKTISHNHVLSNKAANSFMQLYLSTHFKFTLSLTIFEELAENVGAIMGLIKEEDYAEVFQILNVGTVHNILLTLCGNFNSILEDVDFLIARLKSKFSMILYTFDNAEQKTENLKRTERKIVCQMGFVVVIIKKICNISIHHGNISEAIFRNIAHTYSTLTSLCKYFLSRSSKQNLAFQDARFECLIKTSGKEFAVIVYHLIHHIEKQDHNDIPKKKNTNSNLLKSKVLRETRLIPKTIYDLEQYHKSIIQLSKKTKSDFSKYVGVGNVRDFRIYKLKEALDVAEPNLNATASTSTSQNTEMDVSEEESFSHNDNDLENISPPPSKKSKC